MARSSGASTPFGRERALLEAAGEVYRASPSARAIRSRVLKRQWEDRTIVFTKSVGRSTPSRPVLVPGITYESQPGRRRSGPLPRRARPGHSPGVLTRRACRRRTRVILAGGLTPRVVHARRVLRPRENKRAVLTNRHRGTATRPPRAAPGAFAGAIQCPRRTSWSADARETRPPPALADDEVPGGSRNRQPLRGHVKARGGGGRAVPLRGGDGRRIPRGFKICVHSRSTRRESDVAAPTRPTITLRTGSRGSRCHTRATLDTGSSTRKQYREICSRRYPEKGWRNPQPEYADGRERSPRGVEHRRRRPDHRTTCPDPGRLYAEQNLQWPWEEVSPLVFHTLSSSA